MVVYTCPSIIVLFIFITDNTITFENANDIITYFSTKSRASYLSREYAYRLFYFLRAPIISLIRQMISAEWSDISRYYTRTSPEWRIRRSDV